MKKRVASLAMGAMLLTTSLWLAAHTTPTYAATTGSYVIGSNNPYRAQFSSEYAVQIDKIVASVLTRGKNLSQEQFASYLSSISTGIRAIGAKPAYRDNADIQNIISYLDFELNAAKNSLNQGGNFTTELTALINGSSTATSSPQSTNTPAPQVTPPPATPVVTPSSTPAPTIAVGEPNGIYDLNTCGPAAGSDMENTMTQDPVKSGLIVPSKRTGRYTKNYEYNGKLLCNIGAEAVFVNTDQSGNPLGSTIEPTGIFRYKCRIDDAYYQTLSSSTKSAYSGLQSNDTCTIQRKSIFSYDDQSGILVSKVQNLSFALKHSENYPVANTPISSVEELKNYCATIRDGGYTNWRLPTNAEVRNLSAALHREPLIDKTRPFGRYTTAPLNNYDFLDAAGQTKYGYQWWDGTPVATRRDPGLYPYNLVSPSNGEGTLKWVAIDPNADSRLDSQGYIAGLVTLPANFDITGAQVENLAAKRAFSIGQGQQTAVVCVR